MSCSNVHDSNHHGVPIVARDQTIKDFLGRALILLDLVGYSCQEAVIRLGAVLLDEFQKFQC